MIDTSPYIDSRRTAWKAKSAAQSTNREYSFRLYSNSKFGAQPKAQSPFRTFSPSEKLLQNLSRLNEFARAKQGWNGYDAQPFAKQSLTNTRELLLRLQSQQPFVSPLTDGGVQIDWELGDRTLEVEVYADCFNFLDEAGNESVKHDQASALAYIKSWLNG